MPRMTPLSRDEKLKRREAVRLRAAAGDLRHPLRAEPDDLLVVTADEVPPHDEGFVERLPADQQQAGIDIVSDGEQTRQHFVTTFIEHLDGVDFQKRNRQDPRPLRCQRSHRRGRRVPPEARFRRGRKVPARADGPADQMGPAGSDDHDRYAV